MPREADAHATSRSLAPPHATRRPVILGAALAAFAGLLLHVAVGRSEPSAVAGALFIFALAMALRGASTRRCALYGAVAGLATWLPSSAFALRGAEAAGASTTGGLEIAILVATLHAARLAATGLLATRLAQRGAPLGLATALAYVAAETLDPAPIPWSLGAATVDRPWLSAAADLGGPPLAALVLALAGGVLADAADRARPRGARGAEVPPPGQRVRLASALLLASLVIRGRIATREIEDAMLVAPKKRVAAIHTEAERGGQRLSPATVLAWVDAASVEADTVVLPEASFTFTSERVATDVLQASFGGASADLIVGVAWGPSSAHVNALGRLLPGAASVEWYVKSRPFPVGEANDGLTRVLGLETSPGLLDRGSVAATDAFRGARGAASAIVPAICWEDLFADAGQRAARAGPSWIVVGVNDGWFASSAAGGQHLLHARIRAIEARRAIVRSTNLGATSIIDPLGGVIPRARGARFVTATIPLMEVETVAMRTRGAIPLALAAVVIALAALGPRRVRPRASSAAS